MKRSSFIGIKPGPQPKPRKRSSKVQQLMQADYETQVRRLQQFWAQQPQVAETPAPQPVQPAPKTRADRTMPVQRRIY